MMHTCTVPMTTIQDSSDKVSGGDGIPIEHVLSNNLRCSLKALFLIENSLFVVVIFYYDHIRVSTTGFLLG